MSEQVHKAMVQYHSYQDTESELSDVGSEMASSKTTEKYFLGWRQTWVSEDFFQ